MRQLCGKEHLESRTDNVWWRPSGGMVGEKTEDRAFGVNITFFGSWTGPGYRSIWSRGHIITFGDNSAGGEGPQHRHCCQINSQNTHDHHRTEQNRTHMIISVQLGRALEILGQPSVKFNLQKKSLNSEFSFLLSNDGSAFSLDYTTFRVFVLNESLCCCGPSVTREKL